MMKHYNVLICCHCYQCGIRLVKTLPMSQLERNKLRDKADLNIPYQQCLCTGNMHIASMESEEIKHETY